MGFLQPNLPQVDYESWSKLPRAERVKPLARHFAEHGFGTPDVVLVAYLIKIVIYLAIGWVFVMTTPGIEGWFDVSSWWRNPAVFYKFVLWTMLFEVLGLGCGFGPLNLRFIPPLGSFLYWLRPGTVRLPPWRGSIPLTGGDTRTVIDVVLYAGLLVSLVWALVGAITWTQVLVVLVVLAAVSLRDQVIFLAARGEVYATLALTFLFAAGDQVDAAKLVMVLIWWGAAVSKLNPHFPFVVSTMMSNSPMWRLGGMKKLLHRDFPDDLRPSRIAAVMAHAGTVVELAVPAVLLVSNGGWLTTTAAVVMILFHLNIIFSMPMGVPLEWNVFMIVGVVTLFLAHPGFSVDTLTNPWVLLLIAVAGGLVIYGNFVPEKVSFLISMRYYAGNWPATVWCFRGDAFDRIDSNIVKASMLPHQQLEKVYGNLEEAAVPLHMGYAFRGFHPHGRAFWALIPRVCDGDHEQYVVFDGELISGAVLGWNFGDGHLQGDQFIEALQRRCNFAPGDVRVILLESQPAHRRTQDYRLVDAATGEFERGHVKVDDMIVRQPVDTDLPPYPD